MAKPSLRFRNVKVVVPKHAEPGDLIGYMGEPGSTGLTLCLKNKPPGSIMEPCSMLGYKKSKGTVGNRDTVLGVIIRKKDSRRYVRARTRVCLCNSQQPPPGRQ